MKTVSSLVLCVAALSLTACASAYGPNREITLRGCGPHYQSCHRKGPTLANRAQKLIRTKDARLDGITSNTVIENYYDGTATVIDSE